MCHGIRIVKAVINYCERIKVVVSVGYAHNVIENLIVKDKKQYVRDRSERDRENNIQEQRSWQTD